jgi:formylglycine-generating enzyme required for sulfatase activity
MILISACDGAASTPIVESVVPTTLTETSEPAPTTIPLPTEALTGIEIGSTFIDELDIPMVRIPAGSFSMGSNSGSDDEKPVHSVFLDEFYIDIFEVTNTRFAMCVDAGVCDTPADTTSFDSSYSRMHSYGNSDYDNYPVIYVSWYDAQDFCSWREARLPTEAEWEKAARGGLEGKTYPWGDETPVRVIGATNGASFNDASNITDTDQVGSYSPNGYGLFDMAGNLWEWVSDWYDENYYANSPDRNPSGSDEAGFPVIRGGSWSDSENRLRVSDRRFNDPNSGALNIGFRCARDVAP